MITKTEQALLRKALANLDTSDPKFGGTDEIRAKLDDPQLRLFLRSWILPHVRMVAEQDKHTIASMRHHV